jgi:hypothetical protein
VIQVSSMKGHDQNNLDEGQLSIDCFHSTPAVKERSFAWFWLIRKESRDLACKFFLKPTELHIHSLDLSKHIQNGSYKLQAFAFQGKGFTDGIQSDLGPFGAHAVSSKTGVDSLLDHVPERAASGMFRIL